MSEELPKDGLLSHLAELRNCLLRCFGALIILMIALIPFAGQIYTTLAQPLLESLPSDGQLISINIIGPFTVQITTAALAAFLIALPYLWFEVWRFVAPGLYANEKKLILPLIASSTLLFYAGMVFAYFMVFHVVFGFIASVAPQEIVWTPDIQEFFSFAITLFIAFGAAFETPVAVYILARAGIVDVETMRKARPYVVVGAFVVAAIFTPPDIISQFLLAIPCWLLFELGLLLAPKKSRDEERNDENDETKD
ncbi:MAG: twin-arginine translocase subunit TatC [Gammaproteobacteria bacterium WSBS_2016_MAG_OTU1]